MYKRLTISLVLMGLAAFSLAAGAVAYFSDGTRSDVSISAGTADLKFIFDVDCNEGDPPTGEVDAVSETLEWTNIVPGESTEDCTEVINRGDGTLHVYLEHQNVGGNLADDILFQYTLVDSGYNFQANLCAGVQETAEDAQFTTVNGGRGCFLGTLGEDGSLFFKGSALFEDDGDQNSLEGQGMTLDVVVTGYTS